MIEHQFTKDLYVNVMYLGNKGTRLISNTAPLNALNPSLLSMGNALYDTFTPGEASLDGVNAPYTGWAQQMTACAPTVAQALLRYPQYCGNIYALNENAGNSTYHSLQIKAEKRVSHGFWLLANYTYAKDLTNTDSIQPATLFGIEAGVFSPYQRQRNKGISAGDNPQYMTLTGTYELPFGAGKYFLNQKGILNGVVGGWQLSTVIHANAGWPLWFTSSACKIPGQFAESCLPGQIPGSDMFAQKPSSFDPGKGPLLTSTAFESPSDFNFNQGSGTRISNQRVFPDRNEDLSLTKKIPISERFSMQFRAEAFNVWNLHYFAPPASTGSGAVPVNNDVASPNFGVWSGAVSNPRVLQLGAKFLF